MTFSQCASRAAKNSKKITVEYQMGKIKMAAKSGWHQVPTIFPNHYANEIFLKEFKT